MKHTFLRGLFKTKVLLKSFSQEPVVCTFTFFKFEWIKYRGFSIDLVSPGIEWIGEGERT